MSGAVGLRSVRCLAVVTAVAAGLSLAACSSDDSKDEKSSSSAPTTQVAALPSAAELNDILNRAVDPALPIEQKVDTVQGGEQATELFDIMTRSKEESGASLQVMDPVLPGILPDSINAPVNLTVPDRDPMLVNGVEFVKENGVWKLERKWACTLVQNVAPDNVPAICSSDGEAQLPTETAAPAVEQTPAAETPVEQAPEEAPAPATEETPAPAPEATPAPEEVPAPAA